MPIVMDMLNFQTNVLHMYQAYGGWTFAFTDYYAENITAVICDVHLVLVDDDWWLMIDDWWLIGDWWLIDDRWWVMMTIYYFVI